MQEHQSLTAGSDQSKLLKILDRTNIKQVGISIQANFQVVKIEYEWIYLFNSAISLLCF